MGYRRELGKGIGSQFRLEWHVTDGDTVEVRGLLREKEGVGVGHAC